MSKEEMKKVPVETEFVEEKKDEKTEPEKEEVKKDEPKKEWVIFKPFKAIGRGFKKAADTIGNAIDRHPRIAATISAAVGAGATYGIIKLMGGDDDISEIPTQTIESIEPELLPEPDELPEDNFDYSVTEEPTEVNE